MPELAAAVIEAEKVAFMEFIRGISPFHLEMFSVFRVFQQVFELRVKLPELSSLSVEDRQEELIDFEIMGPGGIAAAAHDEKAYADRRNLRHME